MHLLIVAAGSGSRMGAKGNKLLLPLAGSPVLAWTLDAAMNAESITWIGVVGQPIDREEIMALSEGAPKSVHWIVGGATRQESVRLGLASLPPEACNVLIHDGARCLIEPELFDRCAEAVLGGDAVISAAPVIDTIKSVDSKGFVTGTPERSSLWAAQTPQGFQVKQLQEAHVEAQLKGWSVTDDASLYERLEWPVKVLESAPSNLKVTTPFDLIIAEAVIASRGKR